MKKLFIVCLFALSLFSMPAAAQEKFISTWESLEKYKLPEWVKDAKFGIFIHWGVYAVPGYGSEWYPRLMYDSSTDVFKFHVKKYGTQDKFGYKDLIPMFKAEKFNAEQWVDLFSRSGAKYVVPVAEHHDGFAMYNSPVKVERF
jgi:alpha-L-fucosidase